MTGVESTSIASRDVVRASNASKVASDGGYGWMSGCVESGYCEMRVRLCVLEIRHIVALTSTGWSLMNAIEYQSEARGELLQSAADMGGRDGKSQCVVIQRGY